jgi:hypothetical protein
VLSACEIAESVMAPQSVAVMPALVAGIPIRDARWLPKRDGRDKPGHDVTDKFQEETTWRINVGMWW